MVTVALASRLLTLIKRGPDPLSTLAVGMVMEAVAFGALSGGTGQPAFALTLGLTEKFLQGWVVLAAFAAWIPAALGSFFMVRAMVHGRRGVQARAGSGPD